MEKGKFRVAGGFAAPTLNFPIITGMTEPTEVEARFGEDGKITVLSFSWRGCKLPVLGAGRQWGAEDGFHFLVMTTGERVFELVYHSVSSLWHVVKAPEQARTQTA